MALALGLAPALALALALALRRSLALALALALAREGRRLDLVCGASSVMADHRTSAKKDQVVGSLSFLH